MEKSIDNVTVENLSIALNCQGINLPTEILDQIIDTVELLEEKGCNSTIEDISEIMTEYKNRNTVKALPTQPVVKQKPEPYEKLITFKNSETIEKIHSELKGYFPNKEAELLKALQGEQLSELLLFPHNGSNFVEVFKRLKYNRFLINTPTQIKDWICTNFNYMKTQGTKKTVENFKENTVWDVLTKTKCEPSNKNRICTPDWLPFIPQKTRKIETENEKTDQKKHEYMEFGTYDPEGFSYDVIYKPGCSFDDFKTEVLNICKNFSKEERNEMTDTGDIIDKVTIKLEENGWIVLETKSAMVEDVIIFNKDTKGHSSYKQNCEFFGKEFIDAVIDK